MSHETLAQFVNQSYLNLESFRRDGTPVQTPLWFAEDDGVFYIYTLANTGKVKRIRRNPRVRIGWKKRLGNIFSALMKRGRVVMTIRLVE